MRHLTVFLSTLFFSLKCYSQDSLYHDSKYLIDLEIASVNLKCDTIILTSPKQTQRIIECRKSDTTVLKRETTYNYDASLKSSIYLQTEYYNANKKLLVWTHKNLDTGIILAGEIYYYDDNNQIIETFKWGSGEVGLRTKYSYDQAGHLIKEVNYRGNTIVSTKNFKR